VLVIARVTVALLLVLVASPAAAQRQLRDPAERMVFEGVVVDKLHGDPLPNAIVLMVDENKGVLTDSLGRFRFPGVLPGPQLVAVKQYGYAEVNLDLDLAVGQGPTRIELDPGPLALEGFTVVAENIATMTAMMETRRKAYAGSVRAHDQARLATSSAEDARQFLASEGGLHIYPCRGVRVETSCIERRGGLAEPRVYIDEAWVIGGLDFLEMFKPYELYAIEVFSGGMEIRAYTHWYMERMAEQPRALWPIGF
jgi:hypothetical protein